MLLCPHLQELSWSHTEADSCLPPLTSPFPTSLSSSAFEIPPSRGKKIAPNLSETYAAGLKFWQFVSLSACSWPYRELYRVLDSQSPKVNSALITQPKAFSPSFHSWSKALPRLSFPTLLSPFQDPSLHPVRSKDPMSPRQHPPPYTP